MNYQSALIARFGVSALNAAKAHARREFPRESCGFIANKAYVACENKADDALNDFKIDESRYKFAVLSDRVQAIVHSHPNGPIYPSELDMRQQLATNVPWLIVNLNDTDVADFTAWGDALPRAPILARPFLHGIFDCYSLVRDTFALGKDELAKQGIGWPHPPIALPEVARGDSWWASGQDLYQNHLAKEGFKIISRSEARPGDGFLIRIGTNNPHKRLNHAGLLVDDDFILHHLPTRPSRREPAGIWARQADIWVRYEGGAK